MPSHTRAHGMQMPVSMTILARRVLLFSVLLSWCAALIAIRIVRSGSLAYTFLVWNLMLAVVPAVAALCLTEVSRRGKSDAVQLLWFVTWLAFLPNAPYIVTDFLHLSPRGSVPLWYDIAMILSCAVT